MANHEQFFKQYASLLRVQSKIGDLCQVKNEASSNLPDKPRYFRNQRRHSENPPDRTAIYVKDVSRSYLLAHTIEEQHQIAVNNHTTIFQQQKRIDQLLGRSRAITMQDSQTSLQRSFGIRSNSLNTSTIDIAIPEENSIRKNISISKLAFVKNNRDRGHIDFHSDIQWSEVVQSFRERVDHQETVGQLGSIPRLKMRSILNIPDSKVSLLHDHSPLKSQLSSKDLILVQKIRQNEENSKLSLKEKSQNLVFGFNNKKYQPSPEAPPSIEQNTPLAFDLVLSSELKEDKAQQEINEKQSSKGPQYKVQTEEEILKQRIENARVRKRFNAKLDSVNNNMLDQIFIQTKEFENNELILDWKNKLQQNRFTYLGYKDFPEIKAAFQQRQARLKKAEQQRQNQMLLQNLQDQQSGDNTDGRSVTSRAFTIQSSGLNNTQSQFQVNQDNEEDEKKSNTETQKSQSRFDLDINSPLLRKSSGSKTLRQSSVSPTLGKTIDSPAFKRSLQPSAQDSYNSPKHNSNLGSQVSSPRKQFTTQESQTSKAQAQKSQKDSQINKTNLQMYQSNVQNVDGRVSQASQITRPASPFRATMTLMPVIMVGTEDVEPEPIRTDHSVLLQNPELQLDKHDSESFTSDDSSNQQFEVPIKKSVDLAFDLETLKSSECQKLEQVIANKQVESTFIQNAFANDFQGYPENMVAFYKSDQAFSQPVPEYFQSRQSYKRILEDVRVRDLKTNFTDLTKQQKNPINIYTILQQLNQGRFVIKRQQYLNGQMRELFSMTKSLIKPISFVMIDECVIEDQELASIVYMVARDSNIMDLCLIRMALGPATIKALVQMEKNQVTDQHISIRQCKFAGYVSDPLNYYHPFLTATFVQLHLLSLSNLGLIGIDLELITRRIESLKHLDVSYNRFTAKEMLSFLKLLNTQYKNSELSSLIIGGNSLESAHLNTSMLTQLKNLVTKPHIQLLDLSETQISADMIGQIVEQIKEATTLVSIHLSHSTEIRKAVKVALQDLLYDQMTTKSPPEEIPQDWFKFPHVPDLVNDDITQEIGRQLSHAPSKYVLSRIIGRKDLENVIQLTSNSIVPKWDYDFIEEQNPQARAEIIRRKHLENCWVESEDCWVSQRWNYIMPLMCRSEIEEYMSNEIQKFALTEAENQTLDRLIKFNKSQYDALELRQAYIIGAVTNGQFVKLDSLATQMIKIDPEFQLLLFETQGDPDLLYQHYRKNYQKVMATQNDKIIRRTNLETKRKIVEKTSPLYPYKPTLIRIDPQNNTQEFGIYDTVWSKSFLTKPGLVEYFVVYKMDQTRVYKSLQRAFVPIRSFPIHKYTIQRMRKKQIVELTREQMDDNYYFDVFPQWRTDDANRLKFLFQQDIRLWKVQSGGNEIPELSAYGDQQEYKNLLETMQENLQKIMMAFRTLLAESTSYPLLNWTQIHQWVEVKLQMIDDVFTVDVLKGTYKSVKQFTLNRQTKIKESNKEQRVAKFKSYKKIKKTVSENPDNELTRFMFIEFLVRISFAKYKFSGNKNLTMSGSFVILTPTQCFKTFIKEVLDFWNVKQKKIEVSTFNLENFRDEEIFAQRNIQKLVFLNHFSLAEIYRRFLKQYEAENPEIEEQRQFRKQNYLGETSVLEILNKEEPQEVKRQNFGAVNEIKPGDTQQAANKSALKKPQARTSLKKKGTKKVYKDLKLQVKSEFLNVNSAPILGIHKDFIVQKLLLLPLTPEQKEMLSGNQFQSYYAASKMSQNATGNSRQAVQSDIQRAEKMIFIEFLVLVCFLAEMLFKNEEDRGHKIPYWQKFDKFLRILLQSEGYQLKEIPENDTRGDMQVKEIKIKGKMQAFQPPTPFSQREDIFPNQFEPSEYGDK